MPSGNHNQHVCHKRVGRASPKSAGSDAANGIHCKTMLSHAMVGSWCVVAMVWKVHCYSCRQLTERGQYRLQSEDGSTAAMLSQPSVVAESTSDGSAEPLSDLLTLGRAAVQSLQPDATEADELAQLVTPLVLGERACASSLVLDLCALRFPETSQLPNYHANSAFPSLLQLSLPQMPLLWCTSQTSQPVRLRQAGLVRIRCCYHMRQGNLLNLQVSCNSCKVCMTCRIEAYKWACSCVKELQRRHGCRSEAGNQVPVHGSLCKLLPAE